MDFSGASFQLTPYSILYLCSSLVSLFVSYKAFKNGTSQTAKYFAFMMLLVAEWTGFGFLELSATSIQAKIFWSKVEYIGTMFVPVYFLFFALSHNHYDSFLKSKKKYVLFVIPIITIILAFTNEYHNLIWSSFTPENDGTNLIIYGRGKWFWPGAIGYSYLLLVIGFLLLVWALFRFFRFHFIQNMMFIVAMLVPFTGSIVYVSGYSPLPGLDLCPVFFTITGIIVFAALFKLDYFNIVPVVRETIIENMSDGIIALDSQNKLVDINNSAKKNFKNLKIGADVNDVFKEKYDIIDVVNKKEDHIMEYLWNETSQLWFEINVSQIKDSQNKLIGSILVFHNISERKKSEIEILNAKKNAELANSMKDQFLANMSHEIRTPINGIIGFLDLLKHTKLNNEQSDFLGEAQKSCEILLYLINDILDISKIEAGKLKMEQISFNIRNIIEKSASLMSPKSAEKNIDFHIFISNDISENVSGDPARLAQILNNLLGNAFKFTETGKISLEVEKISEVAGIIKLKFSVKDTGIGITEEIMSKIFRPFTQADESMTRKYGGTGLGLVISKKLVEMMNGELNVESCVGKGSNFYFNADFKITPSQKSYFTDNVEKVKKYKILTICENAYEEKILHSYLNEFGCEALKINFKELEKIGLDKLNAFTVLISDYKFKSKLKEILDKNKVLTQIKFILTMPFLYEADIAKDKKELGCDFIFKPLKRDDILKKILNSSYNNETNDLVYNEENCAENEVLDLYSNVKILAVEDNGTNKKLLTKIFENAGLNADFASDGREALDLIYQKEYDVIFMDCQMPVMDGYECSRKIREIENGLKRTPIIAMTAHAMDGAKEKCLDAGMDDYITKPLDFKKLFHKLEEYAPDLNKKMNDNSLIKLSFFNKNIKKFHEANYDLLTKSDVIKVFNDYIVSLTEFLKNADAALKNENYDELEHLAHKLKGISGTLKNEEIFEFARELEMFSKKNDKAGCKEYFENIVNFIKK